MGAGTWGALQTPGTVRGVGGASAGPLSPLLQANFAAAAPLGEAEGRGGPVGSRAARVGAARPCCPGGQVTMSVCLLEQLRASGRTQCRPNCLAPFQRDPFISPTPEPNSIL